MYYDKSGNIIFTAPRTFEEIKKVVIENFEVKEKTQAEETLYKLSSVTEMTKLDCIKKCSELCCSVEYAFKYYMAKARFPNAIEVELIPYDHLDQYLRIVK